MRSICRSWWGRAAGLAGLALSLAAPVRADLIFFKDGFVLEGQVRREGVTEWDPVGKEPVFIPKGFFLLDDGPRRVYFSQSYVRIVDKKSAPIEERIEHKTNKLLFKPLNVPPIMEVLEAPEWDSNWERNIVFRNPPDRRITEPQHLGLLTPSWFRADATRRYFWSAAYLTREMSPQVAEALIACHPDFQPNEKDTPATKAARHMRCCDFYAQAGWYAQADRELDRLLKEAPDQKERVKAARAALQKLRTRDRFEDVKRLHEAGRHEAAREKMADFPEKYASDRTLAYLRELRSQYETTDRALAQARRYLNACATDLSDVRYRLLGQAAKVILEELHPSNVDRLDAFLGQARQAERQRKKGGTPDMKPEQLLSLAVTGWLLGSPSAEAQPEAALRLWQARELVLRYLKEEEPSARDRMLADYLKSKSQPGIDEIMQMLPLLPPPEPAAVMETGSQKMTAGAGGRGDTVYHLQLPPEYSHRRPYPVLIVLHRGGQKALDMLRHWRQAAADNGYIVAAPEWDQGLDGTYTYSAREHATVLDTLRDLRRRFQVDSDRVFLYGLGEGGMMAFDVGLSHPDLFAGVLPMGAWPERWPERYWRNGQYLPFYVVAGNRIGPGSTSLRQQFTNWLPRGFPMLWVEYKGRGVEWFDGEVPTMFDWMRHKRRAFPRQQLGTDDFGGPHGTEFCTARAGDNHFYWLSTDGVDERRKQVATLTASINPETNEIFLKTTGVSQATIWLGRDSRGENILDLDRPVTVYLGLQRLPARRLTPSLATLLDDVYQRGDRQHLYPAKIDLEKLR